MEQLNRTFDPANGPPRLADGLRVYAVGDIHGRLDLLDEMQALIAADRTAGGGPADRSVIVYLGDYVDRGSDSNGVVERLLAGPPPGFEQVCLLGNHEAWLLDFLMDATYGTGWLMNGGDATLASYGVKGPVFSFGQARLESMRAAFEAALPRAHLEFLQSLETMWRSGDFAFVHAGVRAGAPLDEQDPQDLIWIRRDFLDANDEFGAVVVHGHTITDIPEERANRIGIDTGAFATGRLTCLVLEASERRFLQT